MPAEAAISVGAELILTNIGLQELSQITDDHVMSDLRGADRRKAYWVDEDPSLDRILSWIRMQR